MLWLLALAVPLEATFSCGVAQATKIVGGVNALLNEFPWQVCLGLRMKTALKIMEICQNAEHLYNYF